MAVQDSVESSRDAAGLAAHLALRMGDNCLILGQQLAAWCGHAPELEEDIAISNVALDLIGQARLWLDYAGTLEGQGRDADRLAFERQSRQFTNLLLVEQPHPDFAVTLMRQFLFDCWHLPMLQGLVESQDAVIAGIAQKAVKEVRYHLDRSSDLIIRLGDGSVESHAMMQVALDALWRFTGEMVTADEHDTAISDARLMVALAEIKPSFDQHVQRCLASATLSVPDVAGMRFGGKTGLHGEAMDFILAEMQVLPRSFPGAKW
jgi:ring-1,2-phenylacetyl-CoA epoxidase subunit PaaC